MVGALSDDQITSSINSAWTHTACIGLKLLLLLSESKNYQIELRILYSRTVSLLYPQQRTMLTTDYHAD